MEEDRFPFIFFECRIQNFSCWMQLAHGAEIMCWESSDEEAPGSIILYPTGADDQMKVVFDSPTYLIFEEGDLSVSFVGPDGSPLCTPQVYEVIPGLSTSVVGPKFKDVVSRIEQIEDIHGDHITLKFQCKEPREHRFHTIRTLEVLDTSMKITLPSLLHLEEITIASVSYFNGINSSEEQMLVKYCLVDNSIHLEPVRRISKRSVLPLVKYRLSFFNSSNDLVEQVKGEHKIRDNHYIRRLRIFIPGWLSVLESVGHCILRLKIVNGRSTSFHSTFLLENAPKRNTEFGVSEGSNTLSSDLRSLYQDREFSDFQLKCGDVTFPVHRSILCARSPVFKAMLSSNMREAVSGSVDIEDMDAPDLELFLEFLYTGTLKEVPSDRAMKLYYIGDKYQVPSLVKKCVHHLCAKVAISNVCDILCLGDRHGDNRLTSVAQEFILNNYNDVLKSKEWKSFMCGDPLLAVKMLTHFAEKDCVRKHSTREGEYSQKKRIVCSR